MAEVKLILDGAAMQVLLNSRTGPVSLKMIERAELVREEARHKANRRTGCLEESIKKVEEESAGGLRIRIVCDTTSCSPTRTSYALFVHQGTKPHDIPNAFGYGPEFGIGGRFDGYFHPGYHGNPFLKDALKVLL